MSNASYATIVCDERLHSEQQEVVMQNERCQESEQRIKTLQEAGRKGKGGKSEETVGP
jgi:hypothetical protein